jgi:hypothetical protein
LSDTKDFLGGSAPLTFNPSEVEKSKIIFVDNEKVPEVRKKNFACITED